MRWKLISLSALLSVTSLQSLHIDNDIQTVHDNGTHKSNHQSEIIDNTSAFSNTNNNTSPTTTDISGDSSAGEDFNEAQIKISNTGSITRHTRQTSEENNTNELIKSDENPNETPKSSENISNETITDENGEPIKPSGENTSQENQNPNNENGKPNSSESDTNEKPESGERPDSFEASRSAESSGDTGNELTSGETVNVQIAQGTVKGYVWQENPDILGYIDIPYGKFDGRFEAPKRADSWDDLHDVAEHSKRCPQLENENYIGDNDCLTLSIFTPKDAENVSVLFHIHNGYASSKSADPLIYGPDYLVPHGVILVLPNYRLGAMGFLCLHNETAPGNAGLKDLALALEWVKDNIRAFGGNPDNVVVSGDGNAAAYAGYLSLCSRSRNLFNKVIIESGSPLSHWALDRDPTSTAYKLAEKIRSELSDGAIYNNTFEEVSLNTILKAAHGIRFNPCIEHNNEPFMDVTPWQMLHNTKIDTTYMIGSASYAGTHEAVATSSEFIEELNDNFGLFLPDDLIFENDAERNKIATQLKQQYFKNDTISLNDVEELSLWHTDASYIGPGIRLARPLLAAGATVYLYEFSFVGSLNKELECVNNIVPGAVRGDIVAYLFWRNGTTAGEDSPEKHMINLMVDLWVTFINTGEPGAENVTWNELKETGDDEEEWLLIDSEPKSMKGIHVDRLRLWTSTYDEHFIEHNSALRHGTHYCLAVTAALIWRVANYKLNYSSQ